MKQKFNWLILLCASYLILLLNDYKNLKYLPNLIKELGKVDGKNIQEEDFIKILKKCEFKDLTEYKQ